MNLGEGDGDQGHLCKTSNERGQYLVKIEGRGELTDESIARRRHDRCERER